MRRMNGGNGGVTRLPGLKLMIIGSGLAKEAEHGRRGARALTRLRASSVPARYHCRARVRGSILGERRARSLAVERRRGDRASGASSCDTRGGGKGAMPNAHEHRHRCRFGAAASGGIFILRLASSAAARSRGRPLEIGLRRQALADIARLVGQPRSVLSRVHVSRRCGCSSVCARGDKFRAQKRARRWRSR